jgi:hypothetical protein
MLLCRVSLFSSAVIMRVVVLSVFIQSVASLNVIMQSVSMLSVLSPKFYVSMMLWSLGTKSNQGLLGLLSLSGQVKLSKWLLEITIIVGLITLQK